MNSSKYLVIVFACFFCFCSSAIAQELHDAAAKGDIGRVKGLSQLAPTLTRSIRKEIHL